jgi:serine/threonine protein kinase
MAHREKFRDLNIGSPLYMSPEGFVDCIYGPKTDVWAFGILIFELLHGDTPYSGCRMETDLRYQLSLKFDRGKVRASVGEELREVIYRCLEVDEGRRIAMKELKETPYFRRMYQRGMGYGPLPTQ